MRPPIDFVASSPKLRPAKKPTNEASDDNFSDLEDLLDKELTS